MLYKNTLSPIFWWPIIYLVIGPKFLIPVFRVHSIFKVFIKISLFFSFWCVPTYALGHLVHLHLPRSVYLCYVFPEPYFLIDKDRHLLVCSRRVDDGIILYYFAQNIGVLLAVEENVPKTFSGYFHIIRMPNEDPSISFLLKDREVTLLPLHHRECFRKKIWVKAFLIISLQYITFFNLLIFAKFAPINFNLPSFFYLAISFSCILNCIIRSSDSQKVPFLTITEHYWGWRKSNGRMWRVMIISQKLFESSFFSDFTEVGNLHCLTKWAHEVFCWVCRWM